jgi:2-hydroxy-3-keto-5-methylthiopentenyl-1-phosphate phosphatase
MLYRWRSKCSATFGNTLLRPVLFCLDKTLPAKSVSLPNTPRPDLLYSNFAEDRRTGLQCRSSSGRVMPSVDGSNKWHGSRVLVVDFDDTCTEGDTISRIVHAAIELCQHDEDEMRRRRELYDSLLQDYVTLRQEIFDQFSISKVASHREISAVDVKGIEWLAEVLKTLSDFDMDRNRVAVESKLVAGVTVESLARASESISLRPGCVETIQWALSHGYHVVILSVNWSSHMIRSTLNRNGLVTVDGIESPEPPHVIRVIANEVETNGFLHQRCQTANDKVRLLHQMKTMFPTSVYVGDSVTDAGALLEASLGIIMGENDSIMRVLKLGGVTIVPLEEMNSNDDAGGGDILYQTQSWASIEQALKKMELQ